MAMRLFWIYALVELAVTIALVTTVGFGWTVLLLAATFLIGLALAGSQVRRHIRRLRSGLSGPDAPGAAADSLLVALGTVLVVIPGLASTVAGALLLLPPTRALARPAVTAMAARRAPLFVGTIGAYPRAGGFPGRHPGRGTYVDGEVIDVSDSSDVSHVAGTPDVTPPRATLETPRRPE